MEIKLTPEQCDAIVAQTLLKDKEGVVFRESAVPLFSFDLEEEMKEVDLLLKAFDRVIDYYT